MKKQFQIVGIVWIVLSVFMLVSAVGAADKSVIEWKFQDTYGSNSGPGKYLNVPFAKWIEEVSNGRIKVTRYEPGALASVNDTYDALSRGGAFDVAALYPGFYTGIMPEGNVEQGLPWGWSDAKAHTISLFKFGLLDIMKKVYAKHNLHLLAHYPMGDVYNIGTVKPVNKLEDLKGMKIRAVGAYAEYVKALGASPVSVPYGEIYMALKMGTIDGYLASAGALVSNKLGEVVHHYLLPTTNSIGFVVAVNQDSWNALPDDLKNVLEICGPQAAVEIAANYSGTVENSMAIARDKFGVQFHTLSLEDQQKAIKLALPIWDEIGAKSPESKEAVDAIKNTLRYLGRIQE